MRYRLSTLLLATLLVASALAALVHFRQPIAVVRRVKTLGGSVDAEYTSGLSQFFGLQRLQRIEGITIHSDEFCDADLEAVSRLPDLESLSVRSNRITNSGVRLLAGASRIFRLELEGEGFSDAGLDWFESNQSITMLSIVSHEISGTFLEGVALAHLRLITLHGNLLDDSLAPKISRMHRLFELTIDGPRVTRKTLMAVADLPKIRSVDVCGCDISEADAEAFVERKANVQVTIGKSDR